MEVCDGSSCCCGYGGCESCESAAEVTWFFKFKFTGFPSCHHCHQIKRKSWIKN